MRFMIILLFVSSLFGGHEVRHINKELTHLNLTQQQSAKVKDVLKEFRIDLTEFREYKKSIEQKRKELFTKDTLNVEQLNKLNNALRERKNEIENKLLKNIHVILNKTQRLEFVRYFDEWIAR